MLSASAATRNGSDRPPTGLRLDVGALFDEHHDVLFRYLVRFTGDEDAASDALQDAFLAAVQRPPRTADNVRAWLFTVATNAARGVARAGARRLELLTRHPDRAPVPDPPSDAATELERSERQHAVRDALTRLSERERTALLMREEGFAHREIATAIGSTTKTIGTLLARATRKLAQDLHTKREHLA